MKRCEVALDYCGVEELDVPVVLAAPTAPGVEAALEAPVLGSVGAQYGLPFSS